MTGFAKLTPAFTVQIPIAPPRQAGVLSTGTPLTQVAFLEGQGGITSEADYPIALDATWVHGADYIKGDPGGDHVRLDVDSLAEDKNTGGLLRFRYTGVVDMRGPASKVLRGDDDAATTGFGDIFTHVKFETGHPGLKALENKVYVGSGQFVLEAGKPVVVEYKISEVSG
ncbi:hypothetical protein VMCG_06194 [Cytospora schulzeri]|uniref:Uncharacterized protein n=1 Tax=Cytospora schulzeri TaxID=448051 RepID=A0A423W9M2_9PEZI|nr:hypothetical protein VMCG_06194 [Valsa malicola]